MSGLIKAKSGLQQPHPKTSKQTSMNLDKLRLQHLRVKEYSSTRVRLLRGWDWKLSTQNMPEKQEVGKGKSQNDRGLALEMQAPRNGVASDGFLQQYHQDNKPCNSSRTSVLKSSSSSLEVTLFLRQNQILLKESFSRMGTQDFHRLSNIPSQRSPNR